MADRTGADGKKRFRVDFSLAKVGVRALASTRHPILVHMVPMRRCNLACTYCSEFDESSPPVPTDEMVRRIDKVAELGTSIVTFSGGEPLLHPSLDDLIRRVKAHGMVPELLTNAFLLSPERVRRLNEAGLSRLQISIDNVRPDEVSKKSLKTIDRKLQHLAKHAKFEVNINSVLGGGVANPEDALHIGRRARSLGFTSTVGVIHDDGGQLRALGPAERAVYDEFRKLDRWPTSGFMAFKDKLVEGKSNDWRCRAGARYLYICEDGLVHRCSQQRGTPGIPLLHYTHAHMEAEYDAEKSCAPYCTVSCVHAVAVFDNWRDPQRPHRGAQEPPPAVEKRRLPLVG